MMWTGAWRRPLSYGDELGEVRAVHASLGVIDVSTLGKLVVEGPAAVEFLERLGIRAASAVLRAGACATPC